MSTRIRELAEQCQHRYSEHNIDLELFAELIVRECASIVYNTCNDGDIGAQAILYEFNIDDARSQK